MIEGVSLIIPAYNEGGAVGSAVRSFHAALDGAGSPYEFLVVDGGSTDSTAQEARVALAEVLQSPQNLGYGLALRRGMLAATYLYVMICDADGTYPASAAADLVGLAEHFDMAVAARTGRHFRGCGRLHAWDCECSGAFSLVNGAQRMSGRVTPPASRRRLG